VLLVDAVAEVASGTPFSALHATTHALQLMHLRVSSASA